MAQEDDLRALGKIMDFMRGISVLFLLKIGRAHV